MNTLSPAEWRVAEEYCKGLADKEVADNLCRSIWTTKSQKKTIYKKLGISNNTELLLYMICEKTKRDFDLKEIRKHGIEILFSMLFIVKRLTLLEAGADCLGWLVKERYGRRNRRRYRTVSGFVTHLMYYATLDVVIVKREQRKRKIMRKIIFNVLALNLLASPCLLMFNGENPLTGEWNWWINVIGLAYSVWFYRCVLKPIFEPMM